MKRLFGHLKSFVDIWKVWIFFAALLVGTNGAQIAANYEPKLDKPTGKPVIASKPTIIKQIIYKTDKEYCKKLLNDHKTGAQH